jgi:hypothetical protein
VTRNSRSFEFDRSGPRSLGDHRSVEQHSLKLSGYSGANWSFVDVVNGTEWAGSRLDPKRAAQIVRDGDGCKRVGQQWGVLG